MNFNVQNRDICLGRSLNLTLVMGFWFQDQESNRTMNSNTKFETWTWYRQLYEYWVWSPVPGGRGPSWQRLSKTESCNLFVHNINLFYAIYVVGGFVCTECWRIKSFEGWKFPVVHFQHLYLIKIKNLILHSLNNLILEILFSHRVWRALTSDWSVRVVYEKKKLSHALDRKFWLNWNWKEEFTTVGCVSSAAVAISSVIHTLCHTCPPVYRITDRQVQKYYLSATTVADGKNIIGNYCKSIYRPVSSEYSSCRVS